MHGHDLTPILKDPDAAWPHTTIMPFTADKFGADCDTVPPPPGNHHKSGVPWYIMLAQGRYKYVRTLEANEPEELYDLADDPDELNNLAFEPRHIATVKQLRAAAVAELRRTGAKMVDSLPPVLSKTP
jgi:arylsulfatase A-like enzyme